MDWETGKHHIGPLAPLWSMLATRILARIDHGRLTVRLPDGNVIEAGERMSPLTAKLDIRNWRLMHRYLAHGAVGFAEAYIEGDFETPDLAALLTVLDRNNHALDSYYGTMFSKLQRFIKHHRNRNTKGGSKRNIHAHYDLGNEFFAQWLDPSMTYSAALFKGGAKDLQTAQQAKYDHLCQQLGMAADQHILEIGCGWGGFAEHAAKNYAAKVDSITISKAQHEYASKRIFEAGLNEQVAVKLQDYRDVDGRYDGIASIEMFEAVGEAYWPTYFKKLRDNLSPNGRAGLQVITIADKYFESYRKSSDFIQQYVFPGGMLPSSSVLDRQAHEAGLCPVDTFSFGKDYAKTLALWSERFHKTFDKIREHGFDDRFKRIWHYYLAYCEAGFRTGSTDVVQVTFKPA